MHHFKNHNHSFMFQRASYHHGELHEEWFEDGGCKAIQEWR